MHGRILSIAGSDSGGGAGIQADIKTITALDGFAMTAITALTAQNTQGVQGILSVAPEFVQLQIRSVLDDLGADSIKIGMLGAPELIEAVADVLDAYPDIPCVLDPVMISTSGARLLPESGMSSICVRLFPHAEVLTPNIPEAEMLLGRTISTVSEMIEAGQALRERGPKAVLMKGGHLNDAVLTDVLVSSEGVSTFSDTKIPTCHTHGTGCSLASAIATGLAQNLSLPEAVIRARLYVRKAIETAPPYGQGRARPMNHAVTL
ncbi:bifunctional hydroxymethylpyrimidine kinase/phosphomethylpyrimidine kinase [Kozakia baliensis]|uniref:bifunctional hydroxymethylpyrimidine kinase/phosphomethylpyrimidine kinase n=1 Tax=Kozakia baliensis TaxID=153496 RepID=UPI000497977F|nr:bifunctional hydroxymethylpyrimidine kinase/phosphomethylpyrimidine kinase [Kozakia baliensis]